MDSVRAETRNTDKRALRLWSGLGGMLRRRKATGWEIEALIGHATHFAMVRRETLCIFHCVYRFMQRHYDVRSVIWPSVFEELRAFRGLIVLCVSSWRGGWHSEVFAGDASLTGFGISACFWDEKTVAEVGRVP